MNIRKILFLSFFYLMLFSYFPLQSYADTTSSTSDAGKYIEIINNADVFNSDQNVVAKMNIGTQISAENIQNGNVYFQWNGSLAYVNEENTKQIGETDLTFTPIDPSAATTGQSSGKIVTDASVEVYADQNFTQVILSLNPSVEYSASKSDGNYYTIAIGQRLGYIKASENVGYTSQSGSTTANSLTATTVTPSTATTSTTTTTVDTTKTTNTSTTTATATQFTASDHYFEVENNFVSIYDNSSGSLKNVGYLTKGQVYPRVADYGDWHQIKFGNGFGYIWKASTVPATSSSIKNLNTGLTNTSNYFIPTANLTVYDNTSGSLVPFASLTAGIKYPYISDMGDWYQVDVSGRVGYVYKPATTRPFSSADQFFKVTADNVSIYDNSSGSLKQVGYLTKGQVYQRVADYGDWHQIKYGNGYGYIWKDSTAPADKSMVTNLNPGYANTNRSFIPSEQLSVYDNSTGKLVPFASLNKGISYPLISDLGDWYQVDVSGRVGYVYKPATKLNFISSDRYFQVTNDFVSVYDNSSGSLVNVGYLLKGQVFPRVADYGDWQQIKYGNGYGYVWKGATAPVLTQNLKNLNPGLNNSSTMFKAIDTLTVYDNTSGSLVPFAKIFKGVKYPIISDLGDWYQIDISGRIGYVYKPATKQEFKPTDKYFRVDEDNVSVYENKNGSLVLDGYLTKGQVYPRVADYGDWQQIKYGRGYAFVWKDATSPADGSAIDNLSPYTTQGATNFQTVTDATVYDNTSGSLVPFGTLNSGVIYPYSAVIGDWVKVDFSGRVGWVYKGAVQIGPIEVYTKYSKTFNDEVTAQVKLQNPPAQTDKKYHTYLRQDALSVDNIDNPTTGTVLTTGWKVRGGTADSYWVVGTINQGDQVSILSKVWNAQDNMYWYEIKYNRTWVNASPDDIRYYMDPNNDTSGTGKEYQFLRLSGNSGTNVDEVNTKILANKGILANQAQAFIAAASKYNINEVYLMAHSFLETGNGTSVLAKGVLVNTIWDSTTQTFKSVEPKVVYNMFGIGALDRCANSCGAEYAYTQGWFTPELAIDGGAKWIADRYISKGQDTLYEMRWNPAAPATHQYSSDIAWTFKIESNMKQIYDQLLNTNILTFDYPTFN